MPPLSGDGGDAKLPASRDMDDNPSQTQYGLLKAWAEGHFTADWQGVPAYPTLEQIPLEQQPDALDKSALLPALAAPSIRGLRRPGLFVIRRFIPRPSVLTLRRMRRAI